MDCRLTIAPATRSANRQSKIVNLQFTQEVHDLRLIPVHRANELAPQNASPVNDVGLGKLESAVKRITLLVRVADGQEIHLVILEELPVSVTVHVHANAHHLYTAILEFGLQLLERRQLLNAGRTPGGPEVQHHDLFAQIMQADRS